MMQDMLDEIDCAIAGRLRTDQGTAPGHSLSRKDSRMFACKFLVHSEKVAYFAASDSHVSCRNVRIRADVAPEFEHERLAEAHDLSVRLALWVKVRTALATAHRQSRERILEGLLKAEELQHGNAHSGMKAQAALVGTDCAVELHPVAGVHPYLTPVVNPCHLECKNPVWLNKSLDNPRRLKFRVFVINVLNGLQNFPHSLQVFLLFPILRLQRGHNLFSLHILVFCGYPYITQRAL